MIFDFEPERIVSLQPSASVVLEGLGLSSRVLACTKWCRKLCPTLENKALISDSWSVRAEELRALDPDLVIASVPYRIESLADLLKAGIPVLALAPKHLRDIYKDIRLISGAVGEREKGIEMVRSMQAGIADVERKTSGCFPRPRVFVEEWGKPIIRSQAWVRELVAAAGGEFLGVPGQKCTAEAVLVEDPEVIVFAWCGAEDRVPLEKTLRTRGWAETRAAQTGRVYCVRDDYLNTPAPTLLEGLASLAWAVHPGLFPQPTHIRSLDREALLSVP